MGNLSVYWYHLFNWDVHLLAINHQMLAFLHHEG